MTAYALNSFSNRLSIFPDFDLFVIDEANPLVCSQSSPSPVNRDEDFSKPYCRAMCYVECSSVFTSETTRLLLY